MTATGSLRTSLDGWAAEHLAHVDHADVDATCRDLVRRLGDAGWLAAAVADDAATLDVRKICLAREILARHSGLADFAFAMQGLGTASVALFGQPALRARVLPEARAGTRIAAFALSEPDAGSDVAAMSSTAVRVPGGWRIDGAKDLDLEWRHCRPLRACSRAAARRPVRRGFLHSFVEAGTPGLTIAERIEVIAPHPLATLAVRELRGAGRVSARRTGRGFSAWHDDAGHFPAERRCCGARVRAACAR